MRLDGVGAVVVAVLVAAGCGSARAEVHSASAQQVPSTVGPECRIEYLTMVTASEAYWAMTGAPPPDQAALVAEGLLREEIDDFVLVASEYEYEAVAVGACEGFDSDDGTVPAEDSPLDDSANCAADLKVLQVAWEAYYANTGEPPATEAALVVAGLLNRESAGFDLVGAEFVAVPGVCG